MKVPQKIKGAWIWSHVLPQLVPEIDFACMHATWTSVNLHMHPWD